MYKLIIVDFFLQIGWPLLELIGKILAKLTKIEFFRQIFDLESKFIDLVATPFILDFIFFVYIICVFCLFFDLFNILFFKKFFFFNVFDFL